MWRQESWLPDTLDNEEVGGSLPVLVAADGRVVSQGEAHPQHADAVAELDLGDALALAGGDVVTIDQDDDISAAPCSAQD